MSLYYALFYMSRYKLNGKLKETTTFFSVLYLTSRLRYKKEREREMENIFFEHANSHAWLRRSLVVLAEREAISVESNTGSTRHFFLQRIIITERRPGTRREFRFALTYIRTFATTLARHMGLSFGRKFDVLTILRER